VIIEAGPLRRAVAASIAIPLVFTPINDGSRVLVDGGLVNPLPFDLLPKADITIAIDVSGASRAADLGAHPPALDVLFRSIQIMEKAITHQKLARMQPDIYLDIELDEFSAIEFWKAREIMEAAAPFKERFRRQLSRVLASPPVEQQIRAESGR
jgi:NTE family protein